jgi:hypothetical protein
VPVPPRSKPDLFWPFLATAIVVVAVGALVVMLLEALQLMPS